MSLQERVCHCHVRFPRISITKQNRDFSFPRNTCGYIWTLKKKKTRFETKQSRSLQLPRQIKQQSKSAAWLHIEFNVGEIRLLMSQAQPIAFVVWLTLLGHHCAPEQNYDILKYLCWSISKDTLGGTHECIAIKL